MSEKRFTFDYDYQFEIYDKQTKKHYDGRIGCQEKLCDLLNSLYDEKRFCEEMAQNLKRENEQLKKKLESLQKVLHLVECVGDE